MSAPLDHSRLPEPWQEPEPPTHRHKWLILFVVAAATLAGIVVAWSHDALPTAAMPQGWKYPYTCCAAYDCRQAQRGEVKEAPDGYHTPSGDVVGYQDKRIKESPDGEYHWCSHQTGANAGKTICLFVPPRGY